MTKKKGMKRSETPVVSVKLSVMTFFIKLKVVAMLKQFNLHTRSLGDLITPLIKFKSFITNTLC